MEMLITFVALWFNSDDEFSYNVIYVTLTWSYMVYVTVQNECEYQYNTNYL